MNKITIHPKEQLPRLTTNEKSNQAIEDFLKSKKDEKITKAAAKVPKREVKPRSAYKRDPREVIKSRNLAYALAIAKQNSVNDKKSTLRFTKRPNLTLGNFVKSNAKGDIKQEKKIKITRHDQNMNGVKVFREDKNVGSVDSDKDKILIDRAERIKKNKDAAIKRYIESYAQKKNVESDVPKIGQVPKVDQASKVDVAKKVVTHQEDKAEQVKLITNQPQPKRSILKVPKRVPAHKKNCGCSH